MKHGIIDGVIDTEEMNVKLKSNNGYFQSVKENRRAGAIYNITGQSAQT